MSTTSAFKSEPNYNALTAGNNAKVMKKMEDATPILVAAVVVVEVAVLGHLVVLANQKLSAIVARSAAEMEARLMVALKRRYDLQTILFSGKCLLPPND